MANGPTIIINSKGQVFPGLFTMDPAGFQGFAKGGQGPAATGVTTGNTPTIWASQPGVSVHPVTGTGSGDTTGTPGGVGTATTATTDPTTAALAGLSSLFSSAFANQNGGGGTLVGASAPSATDLATADQMAANQAAAQANPPAPSTTKGLVVLAGVVGVAYLAYRHFKRQAAA